jgi:hypothetical protein
MAKAKKKTVSQKQANHDEPKVKTDLLVVMNNWERATGHKIKNPEVSIDSTIKPKGRKTGKKK